MPLPPHPFGLGLTAAFRTTREAFVEDAVEHALESAWADGLALSFKENGMVERTRYGQHVEDEAEEEAADLFDRILKIYIIHLENFIHAAEDYANEIEYALTMIDETQLTDEEQNALDRITATHETFLQIEKQKQAARQSEKRDLAQFLLKAPFEFADETTKDLLNKTDQETLSQIINKLRILAAL